MKTYWWLAAVCVHGYPNTLVDGPHSEREGADQAMRLLTRPHGA